MVRNYLKSAFRNLWKNRLYAFINSISLSIGIAFSVLIYFYIQDEKSFDQFHKNKASIIRIDKIRHLEEPDNDGSLVRKSAYLTTAMGPTVKAEAPEVLFSTRFSGGYESVFHVGTRIFSEDITFVDPDFFSMFDFKVLNGDRSVLLNDLSEIVLTETLASKYFGDQDPINEIIDINIENEKKSFKVSGVIQDPPSNSSLVYSALIRMENRPNYDRHLENWMSWNTPTFVQLKSPELTEQFQNSLDQVNENYVLRATREYMESVGRDFVENVELSLTMFEDVHHNTAVNWNKVTDPKYGYILSGIAVLILIIACINYISLSLSSAAGRRLEVGIRKTVGADKRHLINQFMSESLLLSIGAMLISVMLIFVFLPFFNEFTNKSIDLTNNWIEVIGTMLVLTIFIGIIAGLYPSLYLSAFKPISMLGSRQSSRVKSSFTKPLVIIQFTLSTFMIICSVVMLKQMNFITTKDLGYNQQQVVVIPTYTGWSDEGEQLMNRFRHEALSNKDILSVSGTSTSFNQGWSRYGYRINDKTYTAYVYRVDHHYLKTLGIDMKAGRDFDPERPTDLNNTLIVNEALVKDMGWEYPLNEKLNWREDSVGGWSVIGVVKDYHFMSLENQIEPMFLHVNPDEGKITTMLVKISAEDIPETMKYIESTWQNIAGDKPFDYNFLDEDVSRQYESYTKWSKIMGLSTLFAILIACLGLFGLAGINAVNKTKEIGIRKVMGAEIKDVLMIMNKPFVIMALIAFFIASPASWWIMKEWLGGFEFAIDLNWELFVISMASGMLFALLTVSYHAIKTAGLNPAQTLKYE